MARFQDNLSQFPRRVVEVNAGIFDAKERIYALSAVTAADTNNIVNAQATVTTGATTVTSFLAQPRETLGGDNGGARNVQITTGGTTADVAAGTITVSGTDISGATVVEGIAVAANQTTVSVGNTAFSEITSVVIPAQDGAAATFSIGVGSKIGLPEKARWGTKAIFDGVKEATDPTYVVSGTTLSANTATLNSTLNGSDVEIGYVAY